MEDLLLLCAVARWFDAALLRECGAAGETIDELLASDAVELLPGGPRYALRAAMRAELRTRLRDERPAMLPELHAALFECHLARAAAGDPDASEGSEALHHLDELFALLKQRGEWQAILRHCARLAEAGVTSDAARQRLALYQGYALVNLHTYERGVELLSSVLSEPDVAVDLRLQAFAGLAQARWYQTRFDQAIDAYQEMHDLARAAGDRLYQGLALLNIGGAYNELHFFEQALNYGMRSLPVFRELGERTREAHALYQTGVNAMYLGRWALAEEHFAAAIALFEALGDARVLAYLRWADGFLQHMLGAEERSERSYQQALAGAQDPATAQPYLAQEILKDLGFLYQTQERWDAALACYDRALALAEELQGEHRVSLIRFRRGAVLERQGRADEALSAYRAAIAGIEALRGDAQREEVKFGLLGTGQQVYEAIVLLLLALGRPEEAFHYVEHARSRAFLDLLARRDPELFARFDQPVATLDEVQAALPEGALLVEYFTTGVVPRGEHLLNRIPPGNARLRQHLALPAQTWVFAVSRAGLEVRRTTLDPNTLRPHPGDPGPAQRLLRERLLVSLHDRLLAPLSHVTKGCDLLYLVPHGPLHYVPFMALRSAEGHHLLHPGGPAVALAPSATVLLRNCLARPPHRAGGALALGYNDTGEEALRYAEAEARHVARLTGGLALTGAEPKRDHLRDARRLRLLHVAGHAVYDPHDPLASELRLGPSDALAARDIIGSVRLEVDLVTLSACTSGVSLVGSGDELLGLQRAFLSAGAAAVLCTLWEAADLVTLLVMERFYRALLAGAPPAAALRDAQVAVREMTGAELAATLGRWRAEHPELADDLGELPEVPPEHHATRIYADPFFWAPFMLIGRPA